MEQKNRKEFKYFITKIKDLIKYSNEINILNQYKEFPIFDLNQFINEYEEYIYHQFKMNENPSKVFQYLLEKIKKDYYINLIILKDSITNMIRSDENYQYLQKLIISGRYENFDLNEFIENNKLDIYIGYYNNISPNKLFNNMLNKIKLQPKY